jgi:hypothetical protein
MDAKIACLIDPLELYGVGGNSFPQNDQDPIFYWVVCGGWTLSGAKAPPEFGCLTR